jgi:hypothetical protein
MSIDQIVAATTPEGWHIIVISSTCGENAGFPLITQIKYPLINVE